MANTQYPKSFYRVFVCNDPANCHDYDPEKVIFESNDLGSCHNFAYTQWLTDKAIAYTIIQPYDESCRGGYGLVEEEEEPEDDPLPTVVIAVPVRNTEFVAGGSAQYWINENRTVEVLTLNLNARSMRVRYDDTDENGKVKVKTIDVSIDAFFNKYSIEEN